MQQNKKSSYRFKKVFELDSYKIFKEEPEINTVFS